MTSYVICSRRTRYWVSIVKKNFISFISYSFKCIICNNVSGKNQYRWCFVPLCKNTAKNSPDKVFLFVPHNAKWRNLWFQLARRPDPTKNNYFCYQDHFNVSDYKIYFYFLCICRLYFYNLKLWSILLILVKRRFGKLYSFLSVERSFAVKKDVVPRFFDCQQDRRAAVLHNIRPAFIKINNKRQITEILTERVSNETILPNMKVRKTLLHHESEEISNNILTQIK